MEIASIISTESSDVVKVAGVIVCLDVAYGDQEVITACVGFSNWPASDPSYERATRRFGEPPAYKAGELYRRELPYLLDAIAALNAAPSLIIVDGYVWLARGVPGLGAKLYAELGGRIPVVGIAKRSFRGNDVAMPVYRSTSKQPLFVTTTESNLLAVAANVTRMHGDHRVPTLLRRVDQLTRGIQTGGQPGIDRVS
ncbi:MAG: endonuclease V [Kofleriaceae bacterium]